LRHAAAANFPDPVDCCRHSVRCCGQAASRRLCREGSGRVGRPGR
jgi:hypothetical protein